MTYFSLTKPRIVSILFFCVTSFSYGQAIIKGIIKDSQVKPIVSVNIIVKSKMDSTIVDYGYSDHQGSYSLNIDQTGDFIITYNSMSYKSVDIPVSISTLQSEIVKDVVMQEETEVLEEIVFKVDIPIKVKKDTIVFKASSFTDGTEEVAEDILKKLPGVEVDENGGISVQGKSIEKVMVEGDDLFERGYKLLTKNLHSDVIDKVEILNNYSNNSLLKGIEVSDKVALNLTLKEDRKTTLFGNASVGYGTGQFYENKLNVISFNKKTKYYFFGNLNNTGLDPTGDIEQIIKPFNSSSINYVGDDFGTTSFINIGTATPNLKDSRTHFNNAEFASLNSIYNPTDKLKIKGLGFFNTDENDFFKSSTTEYLLDNGFINREDYRTIKRSITGFGKLDALWSIDNDSRIEYVGKYNIANSKNGSNLFFNSDQIQQELENDNQFTDHRITYTKRTQNKNALLVTGRYIYDQKPQDYNLDTFIYEELFPNNDNIQAVKQRSAGLTNYFGLETNYIINNDRNNIDIRLGFQHRNEKLTSSLFLIDNNKRITNAGEAYLNDLNYLINDAYGKLKYKYRLGNLDINLSLETHQLLTTIKNEDTNTSDRPFYTVPSIGFNWKINQKNVLSGVYRYNTTNFSLSDIYDGFILTGYRDFQKGMGSFNQLNGSFFVANYTYGAWTDEFLINASFLYQKDDNYVSNRSEIATNYSISEKIILNSRDFLSVNLNLDKFVDKISSNFKINGSFSQNNFENIVNSSNIREIESLRYTYGAEMRSAFSGFFNFHIGTEWETMQVQTTIKNKNTDNMSFFDLNFSLSQKLTFQIANERYYFGSLDRDNIYYFTDLDAQYVIKKNALTLKFTAQNIWNTDNFASYYISDTAISNTQYRLLPRYFLLKIDFRF